MINGRFHNFHEGILREITNLREECECLLETDSNYGKWKWEWGNSGTNTWLNSKINKMEQSHLSQALSNKNTDNNSI